MAASFVAKSTKKNQSSVGTSTANMPAGYAAGDLLVLAASGFRSGSTPFSTPSGWTALGSALNWGGVNTYLWYLLAASGSETAPVVAFTTGTGFIETQVYAYTGVRQVTPIDVSASFGSTSSTSSVVSPTITTLTANAKVVHFGCSQSSETWTAPPGDTLRASDVATSLTGNFLADNTKVAAGSTGTATWTLFTAAAIAIGASFAIAAPLSNVDAPFISSATTVYTPTLSAGAAPVSAPFISAASSVYTPTLAPSGVASLSAPFISAASAVYTPTLVPSGVSFSAPFIASTSAAYAPTLVASGSAALTAPYIVAATVLYAPTLSDSWLVRHDDTQVTLRPGSLGSFTFVPHPDTPLPLD